MFYPFSVLLYSYCPLHLPMNARALNMFSRDVKLLSFRCQTLTFSRPNVKLTFSALLKGKMFWINKKGRNHQIGVPISNDLRNQVKELAQDYCFSEVGRRLRISKGAVSKIVKPCNLTGSTAPKKLNHVWTVPKCTFRDSILLETMVQARGSSSLKELHDDFAIHSDCGELSTSSISRNIRNKLPSGRNYFRKKIGEMCVRAFYSWKYSVHSVVHWLFKRQRSFLCYVFRWVRFWTAWCRSQKLWFLTCRWRLRRSAKILVYRKPHPELSGWVWWSKIWKHHRRSIELCTVFTIKIR